MTPDQASHKVIGLAIEVHRVLGPGLLESAYEEALCYELSHAKMNFRRQVDLPVVYKDIRLKCDYRIDPIVEGGLILELKAVEKILPVHKAQLLTYLKLTGITLGLLINFNAPILTEGLKRIVLRHPGSLRVFAPLR